MLIDGTVRSFLDRLGAADPVPGGGSASALAAAMAAELFKMVMAVTRSKEEEKRDLLTPLQARVSAAADTLAGLVDRDADAYSRVRDAYRMPKETEDDRNQRDVAIQLGLREATTVPLDVLASCLELLEVAPDVVLYGRASCISDAGTGNFLALSAAMGAFLNVQANMAHILDEAFVTSAWSRATDLLERCQACFEKSRLQVVERMG